MRNYFAIGLLLLAVGCDKKPENQSSSTSPSNTASAKPSSTTGINAVGSAIASAVGSVKDVIDQNKALLDTKGKALSTEDMEKLLVGLASCTVNEDGNIDYKCEALKAYHDARNAKTAALNAIGNWSSLGKKHLKHTAPAVRVQSASLMASLFGADKDSTSTILQAIADEKDPLVLPALLDVVGSRANQNQDVGKLLLQMADHATPAVRRKAVSWLTTSWAKDVPKRTEKLIERLEKETDKKTKNLTCQLAGKTGDDKLVPVYDKLTKDDKDSDLYTDCMRGLLEMWTSFPFFETESEKAYKLFLSRLSETPRTEHKPPWILMGSFAYLGGDGERIQKWREKAKWFKKDDLVKVLDGIIKDEKANWMARSGAARSFEGLKVPKKHAEDLIKDCAKCNMHVLSALKEVATKLK